MRITNCVVCRGLNRQGVIELEFHIYNIHHNYSLDIVGNRCFTKFATIGRKNNLKQSSDVFFSICLLKKINMQ